MRILTASSLLALSLCTAQAAAQENDDQSPAQPDKCRIVPEDSNGVPTLGDNAGKLQKPLEQELGACRGVLTPPPTGDGDIIEPPPEGGITPVITPPKVPEQQPSN